MKKLLLVTSILLLSSAFLIGCGDKKSNTTMNQQDQTQSQLQTQTNAIPDQNAQQDGLTISQTTERPVAVMIDNEGIAKTRHAGLDKAYIVYEMIAEGGETRMMALFKGINPENIGPVRSSRHYFIHYAMEHDPVYVHFGWSPLAQVAIKKLHVNNINCLYDNIYWRNPKKRGDWQNAFTSMENIKKMMAKKKYRDTTEVSVFKYSPSEIGLDEGIKAFNVKIPYTGLRVSTNYEYDETNKVYKQFLGTKPHTDSISGIQYTARNIIITAVKNYILNDGQRKGRQQMNTVGSGKGYLITNGKAIKITWEKSSETAKSIYRDKNGNEIMLNNGQTWIHIIPTQSYNKLTIE